MAWPSRFLRNYIGMQPEATAKHMSNMAATDPGYPPSSSQIDLNTICDDDHSPELAELPGRDAIDPSESCVRHSAEHHHDTGSKVHAGRRHIYIHRCRCRRNPASCGLLTNFYAHDLV